MFRLPTTATAPFCPSEVRGTVAVPPGLPLWKKLLRFAGPGLLVSVGYMDPGNWATDIEAGSHYGYALLFVVLLSSLAAMVLQCLSARLGIVTGMDLARASRNRYQPGALRVQWLLAELSIIACDLAEVLGCALAFHLLLGVPILWGVALTALDTLIVLGLKGKNFRQLEAIVLGLILTIGLCYFVELVLIKPHWPSVAAGLMPSWQAVSQREPLYLAIGILGATVMPHNLYLHSSIVQTRMTANTEDAKREAIGLSRLDTIASLGLALLVNGAILILAAAAFNAHGHQNVADIEDAYHLLEPIVGTALAGLLFGGALVGVVALILHARAVVMPRWVFAGLLAVVLVPLTPAPATAPGSDNSGEGAATTDSLIQIHTPHRHRKRPGAPYRHRNPSPSGVAPPDLRPPQGQQRRRADTSCRRGGSARARWWSGTSRPGRRGARAGPGPAPRAPPGCGRRWRG